MKKLLLFFGFAMFYFNPAWSQCVSTCSGYVGTSIPFNTVSVVGHNTVTLGDEELSTALPIGFNFNFFCAQESQFLISSNGWVTFNLSETDPSYDVYPMPSNGGIPTNLIALYWMDFDPGVGGTITYKTIGTAPNRQCIVTFIDVPLYEDNNILNSAQLIMYETSNMIDIYTIDIDNDGFEPGTQGIEDAGGSTGYAIPGSNYQLLTGSGSGYRFSFDVMPTPPTAPASISGNVTNICAGTPVTYSTTQIPGATYQWTLPSGWTGTSTQNTIAPIAGASGSIMVAAVYTCGTSADVELPVTITPAPVLSLITPLQAVCSGNSVTITPSGASTYTLEPGTLVGNSAFVLTPNVTTTYTLYGTNASNCSAIINPMNTVVINETPTITVNSGTICAGQSFTMTPTGADSYNFSNGFSVVNPPAGVYTYSIVGTGTDACVSAPVVSNLMVNANPTITLNASSTNICKNEHATITASGADSYAWANGPATAVNSVTPAITTIYTVTGTNAEGCSKISMITVSVNDCVGIRELNKANEKITVYPNPSEGIFNIKTAEAVTVFVYDIQGRVVLKQEVKEGDSVINLDQQASGQYLLKTVSENKTQSTILIKQ